MFKKTLIAVLIGACIAPTTFATSIFNQFGMELIKSTTPAKLSSASMPANVHYTDFSGTWVGLCAVNEHSVGEQQTLVIVNDANSININGNELAIGGFLSMSYTKHHFAIDEHLMLNWNANELVADGVLVARSNAPVLTKVVSTKISLALVDGGLVLKGRASSEEDHVSMDINCQLSAAQ